MKVNPLHPYLGRNLLFFKTQSSGCNKCSKFTRRSFGNDFNLDEEALDGGESATCNLSIPSD